MKESESRPTRTSVERAKQKDKKIKGKRERSEAKRTSRTSRTRYGQRSEKKRREGEEDKGAQERSRQERSRQERSRSTQVEQHRSGIEKKRKRLVTVCDKSTNRGLISEDHSTEATLLFTIPRSCLSRLHRIYLRKF